MDRFIKIHGPQKTLLDPKWTLSGWFSLGQAQACLELNSNSNKPSLNCRILGLAYYAPAQLFGIVYYNFLIYSHNCWSFVLSMYPFLYNNKSDFVWKWEQSMVYSCHKLVYFWICDAGYEVRHCIGCINFEAMCVWMPFGSYHSWSTKTLLHQIWVRYLCCHLCELVFRPSISSREHTGVISNPSWFLICISMIHK